MSWDEWGTLITDAAMAALVFRLIWSERQLRQIDKDGDDYYPKGKAREQVQSSVNVFLIIAMLLFLLGLVLKAVGFYRQ